MENISPDRQHPVGGGLREAGIGKHIVNLTKRVAGRRRIEVGLGRSGNGRKILVGWAARIHARSQHGHEELEARLEPGTVANQRAETLTRRDHIGQFGPRHAQFSDEIIEEFPVIEPLQFQRHLVGQHEGQPARESGRLLAIPRCG